MTSSVCTMKSLACRATPLTPHSLQSVLGLAAIALPRTIEALLLHALRPAAAELLTRKLERADEALLRAGQAVTEQVQCVDASETQPLRQ